MRRKIYVSLEPSEAKALLDLAQREYRDPRRQAALLLRDGLNRAGALPSEPSEPNCADASAALSGRT